MASLPWTRLYISFPTGPKAVALGVTLQKPLAWAHAVRLWCYAARHQQDGHFVGPSSVAVIEHAAGWDGSPGAFVEACCLPHIRLLDETERGFYIHDWHEHGGAHVEKLKKDRVRKKAERSAKRPRNVRRVSADKKRTSAERREMSEPASLSPSPSPSPSPSSSPLAQVVSLQLPTVSSSVGGCRGENEN